MEDIIVSVPKSDAQFVARLLEKMGYCIRNKKLKGSNAPTFRELFERAQQESSMDHEWTLDEINAEIKSARQEAAEIYINELGHDDGDGFMDTYMGEWKSEEASLAFRG